ncbi:MAG: hypothetical protein ACRCXT_12420 [Paraclostridium sp.]
MLDSLLKAILSSAPKTKEQIKKEKQQKKENKKLMELTKELGNYIIDNDCLEKLMKGDNTYNLELSSQQFRIIVGDVIKELASTFAKNNTIKKEQLKTYETLVEKILKIVKEIK